MMVMVVMMVVVVMGMMMVIVVMVVVVVVNRRWLPVFQVDNVEYIIKQTTLEIVIFLAAGGQRRRRVHLYQPPVHPHTPTHIHTYTDEQTRCASGCVVECWICNREVVGSNLGMRYFTPRPTQPSITPGSVNEYQLRLRRQRQVYLNPTADETQGVQVKL